MGTDALLNFVFLKVTKGDAFVLGNCCLCTSH